MIWIISSIFDIFITSITTKPYTLWKSLFHWIGSKLYRFKTWAFSLTSDLMKAVRGQKHPLGGQKRHEGVASLKKVLNNLKITLAGPMRFELQSKGKQLWILRPPNFSSQTLEPRPRSWFLVYDFSTYTTFLFISYLVLSLWRMWFLWHGNLS